MRRWSHSRPLPRVAIWVTVGVILGSLAFSSRPCSAAQALVIGLGDTKIMHFQKMKRVWVADPQVIDVVVASYDELLVYSRSLGRTKLYVWDRTGRHEYAVEVKRLPDTRQEVRDLTHILGRDLHYKVVDDNTILIEGEVATQTDKERISRVAEARSQAGGIRILDLVTVRASPKSTPAEDHRRAFERLFPEQFRYSIVDDTTLVVEGEVPTWAEKQRVEKIIAAAKGITVVDLVQCLESNQTPVRQRIEGLKKAIGTDLEYQILDNGALVISGHVEHETDLERINKILAAAAADLNVVNLVTVSGTTGSPAQRAAETLRAALGDQLVYRVLDSNTLVVEGQVGSLQAKQRADTLLKSIQAPPKVVNLITISPDAGRDALSEAARRAETMQSVLPQGLSCRVLDDTTVVVEGEVTSEADQKRVDQVVASLAGTVTVLNLVTVRRPQTPAEQAAEALAQVAGQGVIRRVLDDTTLLLEGEVANAAEKKRLDAVVQSVSGKASVINLVTVRRDPSGSSPPTTEAERVAELLRPILDPGLVYRPLDEHTLLIEGYVSTYQARQRMETVLSALGSRVAFVNLATVRQGAAPGTVTEAEKLAAGLPPVLGEGLKYRVVDAKTLVVEGTVATPAEKRRVDDIIRAVSGTTTVVNLVTVRPDSQVPTTPAQTTEALLRPLLGPNLTYRAIDDNTLLIEGYLPSEREKKRADTVIEALPTGATVVNLTSVRPDPSRPQDSDAERMVQALRPVLGDGLVYRVLGENTVLVEGKTATEVERQRVEKVLEALSGKVTLLSLVGVEDGPTSLAGSPAARKAAAISRALGNQYQCTPLDPNTVLVEGVAPGRSELERVTALLERMAGDVKIVNMILPQRGASEKTPAELGAEALRPVLPETVRVLPVDDDTLFIDGVVPTSIERKRVEMIAEMATKSQGLHVLSLVLSESEAKTPAARRVGVLKQLLGDKYNYIVWDDDTVLVEGSVDDPKELDRVQRILAAVNQNFRVGNAVTQGGVFLLDTAGQEATQAALADAISKAIGDEFFLWRIKGNKYVLEGEAPDEATATRLTQILEAFKGDADVINLVTVAPPPAVPVAAQAEALRGMLGERFQVRTLQGKTLVVEGTVPTKEEQDRVRSLIAAMGKEVPIVNLVTVADPGKRQVLVHVTVLDINRGALKKLGVDWGQLVQGSQPGTVTFGDQPILWQVESGAGTVGQIAANLVALKQQDQARVLSEPNLLVNEGEEANIVVGGEIPIPVPQMGTGTSSIAIEYREYGVVLRIRPTIMEGTDTIRLQVEPEVSAIDTATQVVIQGISVPAFRTRRAKTVVDMPSGATLVIGGLIANEQSRVVRQIPLLSKLPVIGSLFRNSEWRQGNTELVILVTPEIVQTAPPPPAGAARSAIQPAVAEPAPQ